MPFLPICYFAGLYGVPVVAVSSFVCAYADAQMRQNEEEATLGWVGREVIL